MFVEELDADGGVSGFLNNFHLLLELIYSAIEPYRAAATLFDDVVIHDHGDSLSEALSGDLGWIWFNFF